MLIKINEEIFWVEDDNHMIIMIFGIKSVIFSKKNLTANLPILILFKKKQLQQKTNKQEKRSYSDEATDFPDRKIPEGGYYFCYLERWKLLSTSIFKRMQIHEKEKKVIQYTTDHLEISLMILIKKF